MRKFTELKHSLFDIELTINKNDGSSEKMSAYDFGYSLFKEIECDGDANWYIENLSTMNDEYTQLGANPLSTDFLILLVFHSIRDLAVDMEGNEVFDEYEIDVKSIELPENTKEYYTDINKLSYTEDDIVNLLRKYV